MKRLFKQFSFPGGIPSHAAPETPGSIHEGGELGYVLSHAYGAAFDNPDLLVCAVVGDGEAETGPLATSWHSNKFLDPARDGAVLPILHLNGYKIAGPTVLARISHDELADLMKGYGYTPYFVEGDDPDAMHQLMAATLDEVVVEIRRIQADARSDGFTSADRPRWPMIVLRSPKGWTGPKVVDGVQIEGTFRAHQVPLSGMAEKPEARQAPRRLDEVATGPRSCSTTTGTLRPELAELAPEGDRRMGANPHANGGLLLKDLRLPDFRDYAVKVSKPGGVEAEATRVQGKMIRDVLKLNADRANFRVFSPDETASNRWGDVFEVTNRESVAEIYPERRPRRRRRPGDGDAQRAPVPGLARRLPADRPARLLLVLRGVHPHHRLDVQPARQVAGVDPQDPLAAADRLAELPADLARLAAGPQRVQPPGPRLHRPRRQQEGRASSGSTCRPTPTRCSRSPTTASGAGITST